MKYNLRAWIISGSESGNFICNFKSTTCPEVLGGKEKKNTTTLQLCWGIVAFDLI